MREGSVSVVGQSLGAKMMMSGGLLEVIKGLREAQPTLASSHHDRRPAERPTVSLAWHDPQRWHSVFHPASGPVTAPCAMKMKGHLECPRIPSGSESAQPVSTK
jgi:hypothetical protein